MTPTRRSAGAVLFRKPIIWALLAYAMLLAVSHLYRQSVPDPFPAAPGQLSVTLPGNGPDGAPVTVRYLEKAPEDPDRAPVLLLVHGNPMAASHVFPKLLSLLPGTWRILAPDLPGFGTSTRKIPDYSIAAHADYLLQFMDRLQIDRVHLAGYSMGGGAAIHLATRAPGRVASVVLISSIGVQELELLGDYHLNRGLHAGQLGVIWAAQEGLPHFGWLDRFPLNTAYARNFFDTDQRPLRGLLGELEPPMLIWHGADDTLVPAIAAEEHRRLVPQSRLRLYDGGHLLLFERPDRAAADIVDFVESVERRDAPRRADAAPERIRAASDPQPAVMLTPAKGLLLALYMVLIALATLVSEDLACIGAGMMAARGIIGFWPAATAAFAGIVIGDMLLFLAGRFVGRPALRVAPLKWMFSEADIERSSEWFRTKGPAIILASRFLPGSRLPTYFTAGMLGSRLTTFIFYFGLAAVLWTPALVWLASTIGGQLLAYYPLFETYAIWVVLGIACGLWGGIRLLVPLTSFRGRRLLLAKFRRWTRWEFWPLKLFYAPVFVYVLLLGARFRHFTLFTAANPGIPAGGVVGESKGDILDRLAPCGRVAPYRRIDAGLSSEEQMAVIQAFMADRRLDFPVVLKPDVGERGQGVVIARDWARVQDFIDALAGGGIVQAYAGGLEFGVFYYRYPGESTGRIFSITDKRRLFLTGDGTHTLEALILMDERAVCLAPLHFRVHRQHLFDVPKAGEIIELVDVGTHARGALFLDGSHLVTETMTAAFDALSRQFDGFYFGRYDIRTPSVDAFQQGDDITILELNGVTSEATHIYDPANRLFSAWGTLMRQWRIAFEIGAANMRRGVRPMPYGRFLRLVFK